MVDQVAGAPDQAAVHQLFAEGVAALGADAAMFVSFVRNDAEFAACRVLLACDPGWGRAYLHQRHFVNDPWLAYAACNSAPIVASRMEVDDPLQIEVAALAARSGFASTLVLPVHSPIGQARVSVLCLGASVAGTFEMHVARPLVTGARLLALELHDWWLMQTRRDLLARARMTRGDILLLRHQCRGHGSKQIAAALDLSLSSVNSRFQRLNRKLGVRSRRQAVRLAIECGLILR